MERDSLAVLQLVRLKGRATAADVAAALDIDEASASTSLQSLAAAEQVVEQRDRYRLTPAGRVALAEALTAERSALDLAALRLLYKDFDGHNSALKALATEWQQRDGQPNDHTDAAYDGEILARLNELHGGFAPLLERMVAVAPRLAHYPR